MNGIMINGVSSIQAKDEQVWRNWLLNHSAEQDAVWLEIFKPESGVASVTYEQALDQALCFGWIDSKVKRKNTRSYYQYYSKRKSGENWSKLYKERVERLKTKGLMTSRGLEMVESAKNSGTWDALNDVENLIIPSDLADFFQQYPNALENWQGFPRSIKRDILEWIFMAKRPSTRLKRIKETAQKAAMNVRANQYTG